MGFRLPENDRASSARITALQCVIAATFLVLLIGYWRLQIGQHRQHVEAAERNRIRHLPVIAPRGKILDRDGRILADSLPAFSVLLMRETASTLTADQIEHMAQGLRLSPEEIAQQIERGEKLPLFQPIVLKQLTTMGDIAFVESHRLEFPELDLLQVQQRSYPRQKIAASALGYVGEVSEEMIAQAGSPYRPGDVVGKSGIERVYDSILSGTDGLRRVVVNSRGQEMGSTTTQKAIPGNDLRLTLDLDVQMTAEAALGGRPGAVVALDPGTGEVLAMVSHPSFDPNDFARRIDSESWEELTTNPHKPLLNKAIQSHIAPGSIFKIITGAAALETGTIDPNFQVNCHGAVTIYGHTYRDWTWKEGRGHGTMNFHRAIVHSCDVYFYTLGKMLGIEKIAFFAKHLGLGSRTGIDLPGEDPGLIPSPEWARRVQNRPWWAGETISVAIGQGAVAVTPLQLAHAMGGVLTGGLLRKPHLAFREQLRVLGKGPDEETVALEQFPLTDKTVSALSKGMWGVVNEGGTGARAHEPGLDIAGKTGTAQVVSLDLQKSANRAEFKNNAWFVGYSPSTNPEIVVCALVLQGDQSSVAVPIVRDVVKTYWEKRRSRRPPVEQLQTRVRVLSELRQPDPGSTDEGVR